MSDDRFQSELEASLLPVLCGNTKEAHRLSAQILRRLGSVSLICGRPRLSDLFDPSCQNRYWPKHASPRLMAEVLLDVVDAYPDRIPVLIPCSDEARALVTTYGTMLQTRYLLRDADSLFASLPVADRPD